MKLKVIAVICCALVLCFALAGCGGVDKSKYVGEWKYSSGENVELDSGLMKEAQSLGLQIELQLNEDGTGKFTMLSVVKDVSWEAKSNTEGTLTVDGASEVKMHLNDNASELSLVDGDNGKLIFTR